MTQLFYDTDADLSLLNNKTIAIIGYGSQGHAHALNLKDSGMDVIVGLYKGSKSESKAISDGLQVFSVSEACEKADWIMILLPDEFQKDIYLKELNQFDEILLVGSGKGVVSTSYIVDSNWRRRKSKIFNSMYKTFEKEFKKEKYIYN